MPIDGAQREPALHILRPLEVIRQACIVAILQNAVLDHCDNAISGHQLTSNVQHTCILNPVCVNVQWFSSASFSSSNKYLS